MYIQIKSSVSAPPSQLPTLLQHLGDPPGYETERPPKAARNPEGPAMVASFATPPTEVSEPVAVGATPAASPGMGSKMKGLEFSCF